VKYRVRHNPTSLLNLFLVCVFCCLLVVTAATQATNTSPWLANTEHTIDIKRFLQNDEYDKKLAERRGFNQGQQCLKKRISIRSLSFVNLQYKEGCWHNTHIGLLYEDGTYLLPKGESVAGHIKGNMLDNAILKATPNPNVFLDLSQDKAVAGGYHVKFRTLDTVKLNSQRHGTGSITLTYEKDASAQFAHSATSPVSVQSNHVWYSSDSRWMLVWTERGVLYRINLENFKILSVFIGKKPSDQTLPGSVAISPTGRHLAVAIESIVYGDLVIVDGQTCNQTESIYTTSGAICDLQRQKNTLALKIRDFTYPSLPNFYDEYNIGFYSKFSDGRILYVIRAENQHEAKNVYAALGDSFSSGEGAGDYILNTDIFDVNMCHTSNRSYPYRINRQLNLTDFYSVACSGARINHVTKNAQYNNAGSVIYTTPGSSYQISLVESNPPRPDIMTISISGNDIGFANRLKACVINGTSCLSNYKDRKAIAQDIDGLIGKLMNLYPKLIDSMTAGGKLYVIGYPQIVSPDKDAKCAENVHLTADERLISNYLVSYFNSVIKYSATESGAIYVDVEDSLKGHRLCEGVSATLAVNGVTIGNDTGLGDIAFFDKGMFHPNELGHQLMADKILQETENFTRTTNEINRKSTKPIAANSSFLKDVPETFIEERERLLRDSKFPDSLRILTKDGTVDISVDGTTVPTLPDTNYVAELHSDPTILGTIKTDGIGSFKGTFDIPHDVETGIHTLHLVGPDTSGKTIDVYEYVYIGETRNDFDGDGTPNDSEPCGIIEPSNTDIDGDGIDDACDALITLAPTLSEPDNPRGQNLEEDTMYKVVGSSPETNPPHEEKSLQTQFIAYQNSVVSTLTSPPLITLHNNHVETLDEGAISLNGVLSADTSKPLSISIDQDLLDTPKKYYLEDRPSQYSPNMLAVVPGGFAMTIAIAYSMYKYGKNKKTKK
jgi:lysophospholipase L1-like esterase